MKTILYLILLFFPLTSLSFPDIDIIDHQGDLKNNNIEFYFCPEESVYVKEGNFKIIVPADYNQNVEGDAYDGPSTEGVQYLSVFHPETAKEKEIAIYSQTTVVHDTLFLEGDRNSPYYLILRVVGAKNYIQLGGEESYRVIVVMTSEHLPGGRYITGHSINPVRRSSEFVNLDPIDKLFITAYGIQTGAQFDTLRPSTFSLIDWFSIEANVCSRSDLDFGTKSGNYLAEFFSEKCFPPDGNSYFIDTLWIFNTTKDINPDISDGPGRSDLSQISIKLYQDLYSDDGISLPATSIKFEPNIINKIAMGEKLPVRVFANIPRGQQPGIYKGTIEAKDLKNVVLARVLIEVMVCAYCDIDVSDNHGSILGNICRLEAYPGYKSQVANFYLVCPSSEDNNIDEDPFGNSGIDSLWLEMNSVHYSYLDTLPSSSIKSDNLPSSMTIGDAKVVNFWIEIPDTFPPAKYSGPVLVKGIGDYGCISMDSFFVEINVPYGFAIYGKVMDAGNKKPLESAHITAYYNEKEISKTTTSADGIFILSGLYPKDYLLKVMRLGYREDSLLVQ